MRSMSNIVGDRHKAPDKEDEFEPEPPVIKAERAEERIFEEAKEKDEIISGIRKKIGDSK